MRRAGRPRRKPEPLPMPTEWIETEAQMLGCTVELIQRPGRAPVKRRFRDHMVEHLAKETRYKGRVFKARLSLRQRDAGIALYEAWCDTERSPSPSNEFVDKSVDWDGIALMNAERIGKFALVSQHLPQQYRDAVLNVVIHQFAPDDIDAVRMGLDAVADGLRL